MLRKRLYLLLVFVFIAATYCANQQVKDTRDVTYKVLYAAGTAYDTAMKSVAQLQRQGYISHETRAEINRVGNYFHDGYHAAVDALKVYAEKGDLASYETTQEKLLAAGEAIGQFLALVNPIITKYGLPLVKVGGNNGS